jgi:uncharacterized membrane protein
MEAGRPFDLIAAAIQKAQKGSTGFIHVRISHNRFEKDIYKKSENAFNELCLHQTAARNTIFARINLAKRKFAIIFDEGWFEKLPAKQEDEIAHEFALELQSTHSQNAILSLIDLFGRLLKEHFPRS